MVELNVTTPEIFAKDIDRLIFLGLTPIEAICDWCEKHEVEIESVPLLMKGNSKLKSQLQEEGESLNFLAKTSRLPV